MTEWDIRIWESLARKIALQVTQGLAYLHSDGICHANLTGSGVLFQLADFDAWSQEKVYEQLCIPNRCIASRALIPKLCSRIGPIFQKFAWIVVREYQDYRLRGFIPRRVAKKSRYVAIKETGWAGSVPQKIYVGSKSRNHQNSGLLVASSTKFEFALDVTSFSMYHLRMRSRRLGAYLAASVESEKWHINQRKSE